MIALHLPVPKQVEQYLEVQAKLPHSYQPVGATAWPDPVKGFNNDRLRVELGRGAADFERAKEAIRRWRMFPDGWTQILPEAVPIQKNEVVAMYARSLGLWWRNACRIVYVVDEPSRFGFAYGTLPGHIERGEELFQVLLDANDTVWYEIRAFSRPRHWLAWLGYPLTRYLQEKFRQDSAAQMQAFVRNPEAL